MRALSQWATLLTCDIILHFCMCRNVYMCARMSPSVITVHFMYLIKFMMNRRISGRRGGTEEEGDGCWRPWHAPGSYPHFLYLLPYSSQFCVSKMACTDPETYLNSFEGLLQVRKPKLPYHEKTSLVGLHQWGRNSAGIGLCVFKKL